MKPLEQILPAPGFGEALWNKGQPGWLGDKPAMAPRSPMYGQDAELTLLSCSLVGSLSLYVTS